MARPFYFAISSIFIIDWYFYIYEDFSSEISNLYESREKKPLKVIFN